MKTKRLLSFMLVFTMLLMFIPTSAFATNFSEPTLTIDIKTLDTDESTVITPASTGGSATASPDTVSLRYRGNYYDYWQVTATANAGYHFDHWEGGFSTNQSNSTDNPVYVYSGFSATVTAVFVKDDAQTFTVHNQGANSDDHGYFMVTYNGVTYPDHLRTPNDQDDLELVYVPGVNTVSVQFFPDAGWIFERDTNIYAPPTPSNPETRGIAPGKTTNVHPQWARGEYTVTYDGNGNDGGSVPVDSNTYNMGESVTVLGNTGGLTKAGRTFEGWSSSAFAGTKNGGDDFSMPGNNVTLYAVWSDLTEYNITYVMNGGTNDQTNPTTYTIESPLITLADPTRAGYNFLGWTPSDNIPAGSTGNKEFTATWSDPIEYNITYVMNDGTNDPSNPATYTVESPLITLADPTRAGYNFTGWTPSDNIPAGSTGDKVFEASWEQVYTVTYDANGGTGAPTDGNSYTAGAQVTVATGVPTKAGFIFTGWVSRQVAGTYFADDTFNMTVMNVTLVATWSQLYTVTYNANGGTGAPTDGNSYTAGAQVTVATGVPTKAGYVFAGWVSRQVAGTYFADDTFNMPAMNVILVAKWTLIEYNITYVMNGGTNAPSNPTTYTVESPLITLAAPTKAGYNFLGWSLTDNIPAGSTGDKEFTATWSDPIEYNITYVMNGGTNDPTNPATYTVESPLITLAAPTRTGYNFLGWSLTDNIPAGSTGDKEFTATWSDPIVYNITYVMNNGTNDPANPATYTVESPLITLAAPTRAGYTFLGWTPSDNIPAGSTGDKEFTATWSDPIVYNITYVINGGTNDPTNPVTYTVESPLITLAAPTKAGYTFLGWTPSDNIPAGSTGDKVFTATWSDPIVYNITYVMNGGTNNPANPATYTVESPLITLAAPARANYGFTGWTPAGTIPAGSTGDLTFTAGWALNTYTVTFIDFDGTVLGTDTVGFGGDAAAPADPEREGYNFTGWDTDFTNVTADLTVQALYEQITFTVTFIDFDGTVLGAETVAYGGDATAPAEPEREGYGFTGWDTDFTNVTGDLTVQALYQINVYTVTFVDHDGTVIDEQQIEWGSDATAPTDPAWDEHTFTGWDTPFTNVTSDLTVTAQYTETLLEEEGPAAGPNINWLWWLLLIPGIGLIILLLAFWLRIVPIVEKVTKNPDGTMSIQWGYENRKGRKIEFDDENDSVLSALAGSIISSTLVSPADGDMTVPPVKFEKGRVENVFVTVASADAKVEWKIRSRKATADITKEDK